VLEAYYPIAIISPEAKWTAFSGNTVLTWDNDGNFINTGENEFNLYSNYSSTPDANTEWSIISEDTNKYTFKKSNILAFHEG
jgi:hypothetical protein